MFVWGASYGVDGLFWFGAKLWGRFRGLGWGGTISCRPPSRLVLTRLSFADDFQLLLALCEKFFVIFSLACFLGCAIFYNLSFGTAWDIVR